MGFSASLAFSATSSVGENVLYGQLLVSGSMSFQTASFDVHAVVYQSGNFGVQSVTPISARIPPVLNRAFINSQGTCSFPVSFAPYPQKVGTTFWTVQFNVIDTIRGSASLSNAVVITGSPLGT